MKLILWFYCHVIHVNERMHIQGCQFEVNADDENISPVDNSEISIDAENPWENFILNFPEDVSLWPLTKLWITLNDGKAFDHLNIKGCRFGIFGMDIGYEDSEETSRTVSCSWLWIMQGIILFFQELFYLLVTEWFYTTRENDDHEYKK